MFQVEVYFKLLFCQKWYKIMMICCTLAAKDYLSGVTKNILIGRF